MTTHIQITQTSAMNLNMGNHRSSSSFYPFYPFSSLTSFSSSSFFSFWAWEEVLPFLLLLLLVALPLVQVLLQLVLPFVSIFFLVFEQVVLLLPLDLLLLGLLLLQGPLHLKLLVYDP